MSSYNYDYLSKSAVGGSSFGFKKSPNKYIYQETRPDEIQYLEKSMASPTRK